MYAFIGLGVALTFVVAVGVYLGPWLALTLACLAGGLVVTVLAVWGSTVVQVDDRGVQVGAALLEWPYVGAIEARDAEATRARLGMDADARAFVVQRPYLDSTVEIEVVDAADPHPYWLVGTRQPRALAHALEAGREAWLGEHA